MGQVLLLWGVKIFAGIGKTRHFSCSPLTTSKKYSRPSIFRIVVFHTFYRLFPFFDHWAFRIYSRDVVVCFWFFDSTGSLRAYHHHDFSSSSYSHLLRIKPSGMMSLLSPRTHYNFFVPCPSHTVAGNGNRYSSRLRRSSCPLGCRRGDLHYHSWV